MKLLNVYSSEDPIIYLDEDDYERIERSGSEEEYKIAAVCWDYGVSYNTAKKYMYEFTEEELEEIVDKFKKRGYSSGRGGGRKHRR